MQLEKSPDALAQLAADWIRRLGYSEPRTDRAYGFAYANDALSYLERAEPDSLRWSRAAAGHPSPLIFWYRESPRYLESSAFSIPPGLVLQNNPYPAVPGMIGLTLDPRGRLLSFYAVGWEIHPRIGSRTERAQVIDTAGLDPARFVVNTTVPQSRSTPVGHGRALTRKRETRNCGWRRRISADVRRTSDCRSWSIRGIASD